MCRKFLYEIFILRCLSFWPSLNVVYYIFCSDSLRYGFCEAGIIILSVLANLFSTASTISVEMDWLSVICEGDGSKLASECEFD